jgi:hypothetical protein
MDLLLLKKLYKMVIGNGLLSNKFKEINDDKYVFLTIGVSNSKCVDDKEFGREIDMIQNLLSKYDDKTFIYFSTISIFNKKTPYTKHKKNVEKIIKKSNNKFFIFRIPQVVGKGGNSENLFNFLKNNIQNPFNND